jgi:hypothetical protein
MEKIEGILIVDFYMNFERVLNRLEAAVAGSQNADADDSAWRTILEDEGYKAVEGLTDLKRDLEENSTVLQHIKATNEKYCIAN